MVSHEYRCIFLHIPKCAGTSVETALGHSIEPDPEQQKGEVGRGSQDHRPLRELEKPFLVSAFSIADDWLPVVWPVTKRIRRRNKNIANPKNLITVNKKQYKSYFKFTIVRNPWARLLSSYKNIEQDPIHRRRMGFDEMPSLLDFLRSGKAGMFLYPQTYWLKDRRGNIPLDFVAHFENIQEDWEVIRQHLNLPESGLPHKLNRGSRGYREAYSDEARNFVQKNYAEEIELFNYEF